MRAPDASPLVLLQRSDILDELRAVVARAQDLQEREEKWGEELPLALSSLYDYYYNLLPRFRLFCLFQVSSTGTSALERLWTFRREHFPSLRPPGGGFAATG
jgi:hypothetical protein